MLKPEIERRLKDALRGLTKADSAETVLSLTRTACESAREANFALSRQFRPEPMILRDVAGLMGQMSQDVTVLLRKNSCLLQSDDAELVQEFAQHIQERADDVLRLAKRIESESRTTRLKPPSSLITTS